MEAFYFKFYNKILSLGDEAWGYFSVYRVKFMWGREVIHNSFPKFQMMHDMRGFHFMASDSQMRELTQI